MKKRVLVVAMSGMNNESGGFVDYQQVLVLIDNVERYIFRRDGEIVRLMIQQHLDYISGLDLIVRGYGTSVDPHIAGIRSRLDAVAAGVGHVLRQIFVHADFPLAFIYFAPPALE